MEVDFRGGYVPTSLFFGSILVDLSQAGRFFNVPDDFFDSRDDDRAELLDGSFAPLLPPGLYDTDSVLCVWSTLRTEARGINDSENVGDIGTSDMLSVIVSISGVARDEDLRGSLDETVSRVGGVQRESRERGLVVEGESGGFRER